MLENIFLVVMCHLVGDYVLQIDYIAKTKGENWYHLFVHCALYILPFYIFFGFNWELLFIFSIHIFVDALKARYKVIPYWKDQYYHYLACIVYLQ